MFDLKPDAPAEVRGEFKPIDTNVPGIQICEHLPRTARWMHRAALVRSINHKAGCHNCLPCYTGWEVLPPDQHPRDTDPPSMGSVCEFLQTRPGRIARLRLHALLARLGPGLPPRRPVWRFPRQALRRADHRVPALLRSDGREPPCTQARFAASRARAAAAAAQHAGRGDDDRPPARPPRFAGPDRRSPPRRPMSTAPLAGFNRVQQQAFDVLTSSKLRDCFDLEREDPAAGRSLRPHAVRPEHADRPPAGRARRAVRERHVGLVLGTGADRLRRLGHAHEQLRHPARATSCRPSIRPTPP